MTSNENDMPSLWDMYREGAAIAFDVPYDQVTKEQRSFFKERMFGFIYDPRLRGASRQVVQELTQRVAEHLREQLKARS